MPKEVTIGDVARESGVNVSTVSRALSGVYGVRQQTRERVQAVAVRLGYRPNRVARSLVTGRSHTLALIVSDIRNPFFAEVARGAEDAARAGSCDLILCNSDFDNAKQMQYVESLLEKRVDGILMNSVWALDKKQQQRLATCGVPIVLLNHTARNAFCTVTADNEHGGALAAEYLRGLGHRRIAHLSGGRRHGSMAARTEGFVRALAMGPDPIVPVVLYGSNTFDVGAELTQKLFATNPNVTAIFAANDIMAFGVIRELIRSGRRIPEDVSVMGFDDIELASVVHPPLTTIHQPSHEVGKAAVEILLRLAGGVNTPAEHRQFGVHLVERQSCTRLSA